MGSRPWTFQTETLETILGVPRSSSAFYPEPDSRAGKEVGNKQGNLPDSLHGEWVALGFHALRGPVVRHRTLCLLVSEGDRAPMAPAGQRGAYQRAFSMDSKPPGGDVTVGGVMAARRNPPCPTMIKQENMEAPIRPGALPNGFPGGGGVCPPRGNPASKSTNDSCADLCPVRADDDLSVCPLGAMGRGMGMSHHPPMGGPADWGMARSNANPMAGPGHPGMGRSGPMGGPMINRSNSVPGNSRSILQQQLMDMGPCAHMTPSSVIASFSSSGFDDLFELFFELLHRVS